MKKTILDLISKVIILTSLVFMIKNYEIMAMWLRILMTIIFYLSIDLLFYVKKESKNV